MYNIFQISPIRLANCNLHGQRVKSGISGLLPSILIRLFMLNAGCTTNMTNSYNTNTTGSNRSGKLRRADQDSVKSDIHHGSHQPKTKRSSNSFSQRRDSREEGSRKLRDSFSECRRPNAAVYDSEFFENWVEVGCTSLGPILLEGASALPIPDHKLHLVQHK